ncbi:transposase-like protein [Apiospora arundinis]
MEGDLAGLAGSPAEVVPAEPSPSTKTSKRRYRSDNAEDVQRAIHAVRQDGMSLRKAAVSFNVPKTSLADRLGENRPSPPPLISHQPGGRGRVYTRFTWTEDDVTKAMRAIEAGTGTSQAAKQFGVPFTILNARIRGQKPRVLKKETAKLTMNQEMLMAQWAGAQCDLGFPPSKDEIYDLANRLMLKNGADKSLGKQWVVHWLRRNPHIKVRGAEGTEPLQPLFTSAAFEAPTQGITDDTGSPSSLAGTSTI